MAREIIIRTWCDPCLAEDVNTDAEELPAITLPGLRGRARVIALCETHRKELFDPLLELLKEHGQQVSNEGATPAAAPRMARSTTPADIGAQSPEPGSSSLRGKVKYDRALYEELFLEIVDGKIVWKCPACDVERNPDAKSSLNNFAAHYRRTHGEGLSDVLVRRLGPERMASLVPGTGGVLREP